MRYISITASDVNNGTGFRSTLWFSGCSHRCPGCHNPETHDFRAGHEYTPDVQEKLFTSVDEPYIAGITLSGGDPVDSLEGMIAVCTDFKARFGDSKDIWLYTGYTLTVLLEKWPDAPKYIDYVVDGRFVQELRDTSLAFRGSTNQKIWKSNGSTYENVTKELD